ncbi:MAG: DUF5777 family beta-barrel protein [Vicinamibacterales bacterium]
MAYKHMRSSITLSLALLLGGALPPSVLAADPPAAPPAAAAVAEDDATLQLAEPDFRVINLPTTLRLPAGKGSFQITHRFGGNFRGQSFSEQASRLFGIDDGAAVGFEYRMGVMPHVEAIIYRTVIDRTIQMYGKVDAVHQRAGTPVSLSAVVSVEGVNNFQERYAPAVGVSVSRMLGDVAAVYVVPTWVHNTGAALGVDDNTAFVGIGARVRIHGTTYVSVEGSPRVSGFAPGVRQYGFAIEKRAGGHMFQLNFTNGAGTTLAQIARGGQPKNLAMGFNLARKFF